MANFITSTWSGLVVSEKEALALKAALPRCEVKSSPLKSNPLDRYKDGMWVRCLTSPKDLADQTFFRFNDGVLECRGVAEDPRSIAAISVLKGVNYIVESKVKVGESGDGFVVARWNQHSSCYFVYVHRDGQFGIVKYLNGQTMVFVSSSCPYPGDDFVDVAFIVDGKRLTAVVSQPCGVAALEAEDDELPDGQPGVGNVAGLAQFKDVEVQILDPVKADQPAAGPPKP